MRVLFSTGSAASYMRPPVLGDEQIVCGPDWADERSSDGRVRSLKTPVGEYDLAAIAAKLPKSQKPDVVVCLVDAAWRNLPRNLAAFSCPKVLLIADTHHLTAPLMSMVRYMASEPYDRSVFLYDRHHASFFHAAGFRNLYWFPGLTFPHADELVRKARARGVRQPQIAFVGQVGFLHPLRSRMYTAMLEKKLPVVQKKLSQEESLGFYGSSLLGFNASLNGDLNLRVFETLSTGAALLTDRLAPESGLERLLTDGREMLTYGSADELIEKATHALANPEETQAIGRNGSDWFDKRFSATWRRKAFQDLAFDGKAVPEFEFSAEEKTRIYFGGDTDRLLQAIMVYEGVQEIHRVEPAVKIAIGENVPEDVATMYATLPRLKTQRVEKETSETFDVFVFGKKETVVPSARCLWCWDVQGDEAAALATQLLPAGYALASRDVAMFCQVQLTMPDSFASAQYWHDTGLRLSKQGKALEALVALMQAVALSPDGVDSQLELGVAALNCGHGEISREAFTEVLKLRPEDKNAARGLAKAKQCEAACDYTRPRDLLFSHVEITRLQGSGVLIQRFFPQSGDFITIRSRSLYEGKVEFGGIHFSLDLPRLSDEARAGLLRRLLRPYNIRRILVVPFYASDIVHALVAKEMTGALLCTYAMDDQTLYSTAVPHELAQKLFDNSDLRLAISPEMITEYTAKFRCSFGLLPPIVTNRDDEVPNAWNPVARDSKHCAMVGNIWSAHQFEQLRAFVRAAGLRVDWFGNSNVAWLPQNRVELEAEGLCCKGFLSEDALAKQLSTYPFVLLPSGTLDGSEKNEWLTRLSLPSRMVFILTKTLTPMLVLGSGKTAAARFIKQFGIGTSSNYDAVGAPNKIAQITAPEHRARLLENARRLAPCFLMPDCGEWIWRSLAAKQPEPTPFDHLYSTELEAVAASLARSSKPNSQTDGKAANRQTENLSIAAHTTVEPANDHPMNFDQIKTAIALPSETFAKYQAIKAQMDGYFADQSAALFDIFLQMQQHINARGDMLEIGVYKGRSAAMSTQHLRPEEKFFLIDCSNHLDDAKRNLQPHLQGRGVFHKQQSALMTPESIGAKLRSVRWIHIDGGHTGNDVVTDIELCEKLLSDNGVMVLDDFFNPMYPQLTEAVYAYMAANRYKLTMFLIGYNKAYLSRPGSAWCYRSLIKSGLADFLRVREVNDFLVCKTTPTEESACYGIGNRFVDRDYYGLDNAPDVML